MTPDEVSQLVALFQAGRHTELESRARALLQREPHSGFGWKVMGVALQMQGKDALPALLQATEFLPDDAEARVNVGNAFRDRGQHHEAVASYHLALALKPNFAAAHANLGNTLQSLAQDREAAASLRRALAIDPDDAEASYNLGNVLCDLGQPDDGMAAYRRALLLRPEFAEAQLNLGIALQQRGMPDQALACFRRVLEIAPDDVNAHYNLGKLCHDQGDDEAAETHYRRALQCRPNHADAHNNLGNILQSRARLDEARQSFEAAIAARPDCIDAHYSLSALYACRPGDPYPAMLESQRPQLDVLPAATRIRYWFALGKFYEDLGRYDESFAAYREGNRTQHAGQTWDDAAEAALLERTISVFSKERVAARPRPAHPGKAPIFIVGMPRSGSSLLEQILSSHPDIYGAGELSDLSEVVTAAMPNADFAHFPEAVLALTPEDFRRIGEQYVERVWRHAATARRIIDKMPSNFYYLGMICRMLPNAKIIHAMRDPMDTCFSCYSRLFIDHNLPFTYDLDALGHYYIRYRKLMQHWHAVLPAGTILDCRYEDLVADTEGQTHRLLDYLGLPWNDRCLAFYDNQRQVNTASAAQVRKPIYHTSLARWERYRKHLGPLLDLVTSCGD